MAVATQYSPKSYKPGAAMAAEAIGWQFLSPADVRVTHIADATGIRTPLVADVGYAIEGDGRAGTATVRALAAWPVDDLFLVERATTVEQDARWIPHQPAPAGDTERQLDRQALVAQEQNVESEDTRARAVMVPDGETIGPVPARSDRAGRLTRFAPVTGNVTALEGGHGLVGLNADGVPYVEPVRTLIQQLGNTLIDDGHWSAAAQPVDDGAWG